MLGPPSQTFPSCLLCPRVLAGPSSPAAGVRRAHCEAAAGAAADQGVDVPADGRTGGHPQQICTGEGATHSSSCSSSVVTSIRMARSWRCICSCSSAVAFALLCLLSMCFVCVSCVVPFNRHVGSNNHVAPVLLLNLRLLCGALPPTAVMHAGQHGLAHRGQAVHSVWCAAGAAGGPWRRRQRRQLWSRRRQGRRQPQAGVWQRVGRRVWWRCCWRARLGAQQRLAGPPHVSGVCLHS